jgi:hypothetical protein
VLKPGDGFLDGQAVEGTCSGRQHRFRGAGPGGRTRLVGGCVLHRCNESVVAAMTGRSP